MLTTRTPAVTCCILPLACLKVLECHTAMAYWHTDYKQLFFDLILTILNVLNDIISRRELMRTSVVLTDKVFQTLVRTLFHVYSD